MQSNAAVRSVSVLFIHRLADANSTIKEKVLSELRIKDHAPRQPGSGRRHLCYVRSALSVRPAQADREEEAAVQRRCTPLVLGCRGCWGSRWTPFGWRIPGSLQDRKQVTTSQQIETEEVVDLLRPWAQHGGVKRHPAGGRHKRWRGVGGGDTEWTHLSLLCFFEILFWVTSLLREDHLFDQTRKCVYVLNERMPLTIFTASLSREKKQQNTSTQLKNVWLLSD